MKVSTRVAAATGALELLLRGVWGESGDTQPGYYVDDSDCGVSYVCMSVQTTRSGVEDVAMCMPYSEQGDICTGVSPGPCPTFSGWDSAFQSVSSVCAYMVSDFTSCSFNLDSSNSDFEGIECLTITYGSGSETVNVVYGCVDFDGQSLLFSGLYNELGNSSTVANALGTPAIVLEACTNPTISDILCSGHGTCAPAKSGLMNYKYKCDVGFEGTYCEGIVSNECETEGLCSAGTCNLDTKQCECDEGAAGDQCASCDVSSSKVCGIHGTCVGGSGSGSSASIGECYRDDGWTGDQCTRSETEGATTDQGTAEASASAEADQATSESSSFAATSAPATGSGSTSSSSSTIKIAAGGGIPFGLTLLVILRYCCVTTERKKKQRRSNKPQRNPSLLPAKTRKQTAQPHQLRRVLMRRRLVLEPEATGQLSVCSTTQETAKG